MMVLLVAVGVFRAQAVATWIPPPTFNDEKSAHDGSLGRWLR
jgi:hypothetical protein